MKSRGQILIEMIFALGILATVVTGLVFLATNAVRNAEFAKNLTLATKFASEAIEEVRNERNRNAETFFASPQGVCNAYNGAWQNFSRVVSCQGSSDRVEVSVKVDWAGLGGNQEATASTILTKWK